MKMLFNLFLLFSLNFLFVFCKLSDKRLCADEKCSELISEAEGKQRYVSAELGVLGFAPKEKILVYSKSAGSNLNLWGVEINGKRGYVPKDMIREKHVRKATEDLKYVIDVEEYKQIPKIQSDPVKKPYDVVDGTTIYNDYSDNKNSDFVYENIETKEQILENQKVNVENPNLEYRTNDDIENNLNNDSNLETSSSSFKNNSGNSKDIKNNVQNDNIENVETSQTNLLNNSEENLSNTSEEVKSQNLSENIEFAKNENQETTTNTFEKPNESEKDTSENLAGETIENPTSSFQNTFEKIKSNKDTFENVAEQTAESTTNSFQNTSENLVKIETTQNIIENSAQQVPEESPFKNFNQNSAQEITKSSPENFVQNTSENLLKTIQQNSEGSITKPKTFEETTTKENFEETTTTKSLESDEVTASSIETSFTTQETKYFSLNSNEFNENQINYSETPSYLNNREATTHSMVEETIQSVTEETTDRIEETTDRIVGETTDRIEETTDRIEETTDRIEVTNDRIEETTDRMIEETTDRIIKETTDKIEETTDRIVEDMSTENYLKETTISSGFDDETTNSYSELNNDVPSNQQHEFIEKNNEFIENIEYKSKNSEETKIDGDLEESQESSESIVDDMKNSLLLYIDIIYHFIYDLINQFLNNETSLVKSDEYCFKKDDKVYDKQLFYGVMTSSAILLLTFGFYLKETLKKDGSFLVKINFLEKNLLISINENEILREELNAAKNKLNTFQDTEFDSKGAILILEGELKELQIENEKLKVQNLNLERELVSTSEAALEVNRMLSTVLNSQKDNDIMETVEIMKLQLSQQQSTISQMNDEIDEKNNVIEGLENQLSNQSEKLEEAQEENEKLVSDIIKLRQEKTEFEEKFNEDYNLLQQKYNQFNEDYQLRVGALNKDLEILKRNLESCEEKLSIKETELKLLTNKFKSIENKGVSNEDISKLLEINKLEADCLEMKEQNEKLKVNLAKSIDKYDKLKIQCDNLTKMHEELRMKYDLKDKEKIEAETRYEVLSKYFDEKEQQLIAELKNLQDQWLENQGETNSTTERLKTLQEQIQTLKNQNEMLKKEIVSQEVSLKSQISIMEQKAHENWLNYRQTERKLDETKQLASQLRNRLIQVEKNDENKSSFRMFSPPNVLNDDSILMDPAAISSPITDNVPPPFLFPPPPPGMPFLPLPHGMPLPPPPLDMPMFDRRPPPLGRISSPPPPGAPFSPPSNSRRTFSPYSSSAGSDLDNDFERVQMGDLDYQRQPSSSYVQSYSSRSKKSSRENV